MRFNEIQSRNQLADFLDIQRKTLTYVLFEAKVDSFYSSFDIPKKDGSPRHIFAPSGPLKMIQRKLADALYEYQKQIRISIKKTSKPIYLMRLRKIKVLFPMHRSTRINVIFCV